MGHAVAALDAVVDASEGPWQSRERTGLEKHEKGPPQWSHPLTDSGHTSNIFLESKTPCSVNLTLPK